MKSKSEPNKAANDGTAAANAAAATAAAEEKTCGLIMPISAIDGVSAEHWVEVRSILSTAIDSLTEPRFAVRLVSDADEIGIIQKRIVQNVYTSDIVVCDVSGKNPNVMFELGMRLAFDKPVVIVKDDKTDYSFDTGIIEHLTYPRDLRFSRIVAFKDALASKVQATYRASTRPEHSPFLKNFGSFHVASLSSTEVSPEKLTLEMVDELRREVARLARRFDVPARRAVPRYDPESIAVTVKPSLEPMSANEEAFVKEATSIASTVNAKFKVTKLGPSMIDLDLRHYEITSEMRERIIQLGADAGITVFIRRHLDP